MACCILQVVISAAPPDRHIVRWIGTTTEGMEGHGMLGHELEHALLGAPPSESITLGEIPQADPLST
ncbi:hypothetical protein [Pseudonocardia hydrocarbonoxydans]|uniref:hypothetical protein n=1 Tax=Pseudonocardia hydrocarbonoxydans TaxID=76726 RepID=UPI0031E4358D